MNQRSTTLGQAAIAVLAAQANERVLEIGAGSAGYAPLLLQAAGTHYLGIERSAARVATGNTRLQALRLGPRASLQRGDVHALALPAASVDAALAVNTLHAWQDLTPALAELARVLRPGARLCLAFGDAASMRTLPLPAPGLHLHELSDVDRAVRNAGLRVAAWRAHRQRVTGSDGLAREKPFHVLLARRH